MEHSNRRKNRSMLVQEHSKLVLGSKLELEHSKLELEHSKMVLGSKLVHSMQAQGSKLALGSSSCSFS